MRQQKKPTSRWAFWACQRTPVGDPGAIIGAGNRNRTYDLRITNAPLYQLSYSGEEAEF